MNANLVTNINLSMPQIHDFCQRWQIVEFALFGSVLRDDFRPDSDIDCLVKFSNDAHWTLLHIGKMEDELKDIFQRDVDLVSRRGLESSRNYLRRKTILNSLEVLYVK
ncbi:MAG: nucleotidyltransferase family protein [Prochlorotrichaceae cyanobacterium]